MPVGVFLPTFVFFALATPALVCAVEGVGQGAVKGIGVVRMPGSGVLKTASAATSQSIVRIIANDGEEHVDIALVGSVAAPRRRTAELREAAGGRGRVAEKSAGMLRLFFAMRWAARGRLSCRVLQWFVLVRTATGEEDWAKSGRCDAKTGQSTTLVTVTRSTMWSSHNHDGKTYTCPSDRSIGVW